MSTLGKVSKLKGIVSDPANRPAMNLLMRSTMAMAIIPLSVYYLCYNIIFAAGGLLDYSNNLNTRVNLSAIAAVVTVQFVIAGHVILAFRQDDEEFAKEAQAAKRD